FTLHVEPSCQNRFFLYATSVTKTTSQPSYFVMIFLARITTTFLPTKNLEVTSYEDFSIAKANRRGRSGGVATICSGRNSSRVGTVRARNLPRVLYSR